MTVLSRSRFLSIKTDKESQEKQLVSDFFNIGLDNEELLNGCHDKYKELFIRHEVDKNCGNAEIKLILKLASKLHPEAFLNSEEPFRRPGNQNVWNDMDKVWIYFDLAARKKFGEYKSRRKASYALSELVEKLRDSENKHLFPIVESRSKHSEESKEQYIQRQANQYYDFYKKGENILKKNESGWFDEDFIEEMIEVFGQKYKNGGSNKF